MASKRDMQQEPLKKSTYDFMRSRSQARQVDSSSSDESAEKKMVQQRNDVEARDSPDVQLRNQNCADSENELQRISAQEDNGSSQEDQKFREEFLRANRPSGELSENESSE